MPEKRSAECGSSAEKPVVRPGRLFCIGLGPGDPELLTLKAARLLLACPVLAVPGGICRETAAYRIAVSALPQLAGKRWEPVCMPMTTDPAVLESSHAAAADRLCALLDEGADVGFLNLGDVTLYATCLYLLDRVRGRGYEAGLVSGVPSFCAAAAALGTGLALGEDQLHILSRPEQVREGLSLPGTKIIMKAGRGAPAVIRQLRRAGLDAAVVENCGLPGERIFRSLDEIAGREEQLGYYTLIIVKG